MVREPAAFAGEMRRLMDEVVAGRLKPHVHATYRLDETATAIAEIAARRVKGKLVVTAG